MPLLCTKFGDADFTPLFEKYGVDILFNSHAIVYEGSHHIKAGKLDRNGVRYILTGGYGAFVHWFWDKVYSVPAKDNVAESEGGQQRYVASVPVKPGERYLRIELIDDQGNKAYTNPIYFA